MLIIEHYEDKNKPKIHLMTEKPPWDRSNPYFVGKESCMMYFREHAACNIQNATCKMGFELCCINLPMRAAHMIEPYSSKHCLMQDCLHCHNYYKTKLFKNEDCECFECLSNSTSQGENIDHARS